MAYPCFVMVVPGLVSPTLDKSEDHEERRILLIGCDISSLVIDTLCKQAVEGDAALACVYFHFANPEEKSPAAVLGSVLKQVVGGMNEVLERIFKLFQNRKKVIGGRRPSPEEIVEFLKDIKTAQCTFICLDTLT